MLDFLKRICQIFEQEQIDYMLSGSLAFNIYTVPRMTRDIDIVVALEDSNLNGVLTGKARSFRLAELDTGRVNS